MAQIQAYSIQPDLVALRIVSGAVDEGTLTTYDAGPNDRISRDNIIFRDGDPYGMLVETLDGARLVNRFDRLEEDPLAPFFEGGKADQRQSYEIVDAAGAELDIEHVWRKTKIADTAQIDRWTNDFVKQHDIVLELAEPLEIGDSVTIRLDDAGFGAIDFTYDPSSTRSEAVHVSQLGFEPDDPVKTAYLSSWLGASESGGDPAVDFTTGAAFHLRDANSGDIVFTGEVELDKAADEPSNDVLNFNGTDVYALDFSGFDEAGEYVVEVEGVGTSFAFEIRDDVWQDAFEVGMSGFYHQRSGIALEEEFTDWTRPRSLHPDDGFEIRQSEATLMDTSMGLDLKDEDSFDALVAGATDEIIDDAWGGWHDAGDWDRRTQHLRTSRDLIELAAERPDFARNTELSIPEAGNLLPDILDEALWNVDFFMRLQKADGGVPGGIEAEDHPIYGETSWANSQDWFVYAPDAWSSFEYAATAARAALAVEPYDAARAEAYRDSAIDAMRWAEDNLPGYAADVPEVVNARNLAAAELYRLTGEEAWHDIFLESTSYDGAGRIAWNEHQYEAVVTYSRIAETDLDIDADVLENALDDLLGRAEFLVTTGDRGAFGQIINPHTPIGYSYTSANPADAHHLLVKAHMLTGDADYFEAILGDTQFGLGANPDNLVFTTGLGERSVEEALIVDSLATGELPSGITLFGMWNMNDRGWHFSFGELDEETYPEFTSGLPVHETFNANLKSVPLVEYAMHSTVGPTAYVWGYLASTDADGADELPDAGSPPPDGDPTPEPEPRPEPEPEPEPRPEPDPEPGLNPINGTDAGERIEGTDGNDAIAGFGGNDRLFGGAGEDILTGGAGWDTFGGRITELDGDRITDFTNERIMVRHAKFDDDGLRVWQDDEGMVIGVDTDGDGAIDGTFLLEGVFEGGFETRARNDAHTEIRFTNNGGVEADGEAPQPAPEPEPEPEPDITHVTGTADGDRLDGTNGADRIEGLGGNDRLDGGLGRDHLSGGDGWDTFAGTIDALDGDTIFDFDNERVMVEDAVFNDDDLTAALSDDGIVIGVDVDQDNVVDGKFLFFGIFEGGFETKARNDGNTEIKFTNSGGVEADGVENFDPFA